MIRIWGMLWKVCPFQEAPFDIRDHFTNSFFHHLLDHVIQHEGVLFGRFGQRRRRRPRRLFKPWVWYGVSLTDITNFFLSEYPNKLFHFSLSKKVSPFVSNHPYKVTSRVDVPIFFLYDGYSIWILGNLSQISFLQSLLGQVVKSIRFCLKSVFCMVEGITWDNVKLVDLPEFATGVDPHVEKILETLAMNSFYQKVKPWGVGIQIGQRNQKVDIIFSNLDRVVNASDVNSIFIYFASLLNPEINHSLTKTIPERIKYSE